MINAQVLALSCALVLSVPLAIAQEAQTLKERLSDKASDAQRVDNCHVPHERRGGVPRPDCPTTTQDSLPDRGVERSSSQKAR